MPSSVRLLITNFPEGQTFSDISSLTVVLGVSWGECTLCVSPVDLSNLSGDGFFGNTNLDDHNAVLQQFDRLASSLQRRYYVEPPQRINRNVYGLSFGAASSGIGNLIGRGFRGILENIRGDIRGMILAGEVGFSSSGNLLKGVNRYDTKYLGFENLNNINICVLRGSLQAVLGYGCNLVLIGTFSSIGSLISNIQSPTESIRERFATPVGILSTVVDAVTIASRGAAGLIDAAGRNAASLTSRIEQNIENYLQDVANNAMAWGIIHDAKFGLLLPGSEIQIVAS